MNLKETISIIQLVKNSQNCYGGSPIWFFESGEAVCNSCLLKEKIGEEIDSMPNREWDSNIDPENYNCSVCQIDLSAYAESDTK